MTNLWRHKRIDNKLSILLGWHKKEDILHDKKLSNISFHFALSRFGGTIQYNNLDLEDTMARRSSKTLTEVELEFMQIIWKHGEVSTEDIRNSLARKERILSDGAIRRVLAILMDKGYLERRRMGIGFYYSAKVKKKIAFKQIFQDLLNRAFDGSGSLMVAALLDSLDVKNGEIEEIRRLIEEKERTEIISSNDVTGS